MNRIKIFQFAVIFVVFTIIVRLIYWQFVNRIGTRPGEFAKEDEIPAPRGEIYASDGFPLVANQQAFLMYARPQEVENSQDLAKAAPFLLSEKYATDEAKLTEVDIKQKEEEQKKKESEISQRLSAKNLQWVQIARKLPKAKKDTIERLNLKGLGFEKDSLRFYPEASMAAQLIGFVASDKFGQDTGYFGLEGYYDRQLKGKTGRLGREIDPFGIPILVAKYRTIPPQKGSSLYLSIDRTIQFIVEEKLRLAVEKYGAKEGTVIVAEPKTGNILAMATYPTYSPALFADSNPDLFKNPAVADTYEPGSTFKLITMSSALELSKVEPQTRCDVCQGPRQIGGYEISTWNKKYYPSSTMTEVIEHSDNIGMTFVSEKLGLNNFFDFIGKFGFGRQTGIDLQEESSGVIREKSDWKTIDLATASFGQGIAVTPIQMVQAVGAIANGGKLQKPEIVKKIVDEDAKEKIIPKEERQVISEKTAAQITEMMVNAVEKGEARYFAPKDYRIAGKTGTAQIPVAGHYDPNKTIASFVGFAPADNPRFVMLVRFTEPSSSVFGSETAAPTFFSIAKELFNYLGISPSK